MSAEDQRPVFDGTPSTPPLDKERPRNEILSQWQQGIQRMADIQATSEVAIGRAITLKGQGEESETVGFVLPVKLEDRIQRSVPEYIVLFVNGIAIDIELNDPNKQSDHEKQYDPTLDPLEYQREEVVGIHGIIKKIKESGARIDAINNNAEDTTKLVPKIEGTLTGATERIDKELAAREKIVMSLNPKIAAFNNSYGSKFGLPPPSQS